MRSQKVTQNQSMNPRKECVFCDNIHDLDGSQFYNEIPVEERSKSLKPKKLKILLLYGELKFYHSSYNVIMLCCHDEISTLHQVKSCKNRGTCKICKDKHSTGLYGFRFKRKSKSNDGTNATDPTVNSNCADVSCAAATISQVINMCLVPVRVKHSDSDKKVIALLDTCSQGKLVTEDLISKLGEFGVNTSINIKAFNGNQKQSSSLVQRLMVSVPIHRSIG